MTIAHPTREDIREVATQLGLTLTDQDLTEYVGLCGELVEGHRILEQLSEPPRVVPERDPGHRPTRAENPWNAWHVKTSVVGKPGGKLTGRTVVLKDNILMAGVPMMNGTSLLEGYVPDVDATVVSRVLEAGGEIVGKAHCEALCLSAGSHTCAAGPVHNPRRPGYSAGGSSSGCAALVAAGEVDMAIGCDQGGSIRIPASACGIYGLKPTHGLVPYTGILPIDPGIDHVGPMTRTVRDNALLLEVLAGDDGYDPRQRAPVTHAYTESVDGSIGGLRIGLVREGFGYPTADPDVETKVRAAVARLGALGAILSEVSVPMHVAGSAIGGAIGADGLVQTVLFGDGFGSGRDDLYPISLMEFFRGWRARADELSEPVKLAALLATWIRRRYGGLYYAKAANLARALRAEYDAALTRCDLLVMPTMPMRPAPLPGPNASREEIVRRAFEPVLNTSGTNVTHHPALSVPCGLVDGLPVGMMLIGRPFDEPTIYRAASAFEQSVDWTTL